LLGEAPLPLPYTPGAAHAEADFERTEVLPRDSGFAKTQSPPLSSLGQRSQFLPPRTETAVVKQSLVPQPPAPVAAGHKPVPQGTPVKSPPSKLARGMFLGGMVALGGLVLLIIAAGAGWALRGNSPANPGANPTLASNAMAPAAQALQAPPQARHLRRSWPPRPQWPQPLPHRLPMGQGPLRQARWLQPNVLAARPPQQPLAQQPRPVRRA
jgi:hypothetical protein